MNRRRIAYLFVLMVAVGVHETPAAFTNATHSAGLDNYEVIHVDSSAHGVALADYDNDGDLDIYLPDRFDRTRFYRNNGDGTFMDVTGQMGIAGYMGSCFADYDNDGDLDLFITNFLEANSLHRNDGGGNFTDVTVFSGLGDNRGDTYAITFADYDSDGDLDLYVTSYLFYPDQFYQNNGDGTFTNRSEQVGFKNLEERSLGVCSFDYDNDGDLDIYVANDFGDDVLYQNQGDGTFRDVSKAAGIDKPYNAMGVAVGDYDNDEDLDVYVTNGGTNVLYRNNGDGTFTDVAKAAGVEDNPGVGWGTMFFDYDNDGDLDLYVVNGALENVGAIPGNPSWPEGSVSGPNVLYRNNGDGTFTDVSVVEGVSDSSKGRGGAVGDYDNDGDLDIYVVNLDRHDALYRNAGNSNHWLHLKPDYGYLSAWVGARIRVVAGDLNQIREVSAGSSYLSQDSMVAAFGLGQRAKADLVEIRWQNGATQTLTDVPADQVLVVTPPGGGVVSVDPSGLKLTEWGQIRRFALHPNYPNPFNPETWIPFQLGADANVTIEIYEMRGKRVRTLNLGRRLAGDYLKKSRAAYWDGTNEGGEKVASGVYVYRLTATSAVNGQKWSAVRNMVLVK
jgi:enediyne biosynthesis protein E4